MWRGCFLYNRSSLAPNNVIFTTGYACVAGVAKRLRPLVVVQVYVGSIPITRPIFYYFPKGDSLLRTAQGLLVLF